MSKHVINKKKLKNEAQMSFYCRMNERVAGNKKPKSEKLSYNYVQFEKFIYFCANFNTK
jgi:hypothetical protein